MNFNDNLEGSIISYSKTGYNFLLDNIVLILLSLIIYILISIFVMKPYIKKKAMKEIGGAFIVKSDPLIIIFPVVFAIIFSVFWSIISYTNS